MQYHLTLKLRNPRALLHLSPAIPSSNHLGFSSPSSPTSPKQNVQHSLTSSQLVFTIECRGIPAVLDNYLGKALAIRLGRRAIDLRRATSVYIVGWPHYASRGPTTVLSNTHHQHPLARLRSSTGQQPQTNRRSNHPGSSTFFQRQSPQLFTTSLIRRLTPPFRQSTFQALHHWPSFQSARLLLRTLWKPSVRRIIIP